MTARSIFALELKQFFCRRNIIILLIVALLSTYVVIHGVRDYQRTIDNKSVFKDLGSMTFKKIANYNYYGYAGIDVYYVPAASEIFFPRNNQMSKMSANVNSLWNLNISNNINSGTIFNEESSTIFRYANLILYIGSFLMVLWGFNLIRKFKYFKFLSNVKNKIRLFYTIVLFRTLLLVFIHTVLFGAMFLIVKIYDIRFTSQDIRNVIKYSLSSIILLLFFYLLGMIIGTIKNEKAALSTIVCAWFMFIYIVPGLIGHIASQKAKAITPYRESNLLKIKIVNEFERKAKEEEGKFDRKNIEHGRKVIEGYWKNDFKKLEAVNARVKTEINDVVQWERQISTLTPTTFYNMTGNSVSSLGYDNFLNLYDFLETLQHNFTRFWIDRVFYNNPKKIVNFITDEENVFQAQSRTPPNYWTGIFINTSWCFILAVFAFFRFKAYLYPLSKKKETYKNVNIDIRSGKHLVVNTNRADFVTYFLSYLAGRSKNYSGRITLDGKDLSTGLNTPYTLIPDPETFKCDLTVNTFLRLAKGLLQVNDDHFKKLYARIDKNLLNENFNGLEPIDKARLLINIAAAERSDFYIMDHTQRWSKELRSELLEFAAEVKKRGGTIIEFMNTDNYWQPPEIYYSYRFDKTEDVYIEMVKHNP